MTDNSGSDTPLLEVQDLRKSYPGVVAVDDVSLTVHKAEILGLVGKNGAGKSSLIKILAGAVQPDTGRMFLDGEPLVLKNPHDATLRGLSFVHQELAVVGDLSVAENVELGLGYPRQAGLFIDREEMQRRAAVTLDRLGGHIDPAAPMKTLSVADQRLAMIARALVTDARLVVLDEPTASLSDEEITHLFDVLRGLVDNDVAVIYVSHRLQEIFDLATRVVVKRDGKVVADRPTRDFDAPTLIEAITGADAGSSGQDRRRQRVTPVPKDQPILLEVNGLSVQNRIHPTDLTLQAGEVLGIAGLVGAGRTELVRALYGADRRSGGTIRVHGQEVQILNPRQALDAGIVMLPEDRRSQGLIADFSVGRNITLGTLREFRMSPSLPVPSHGHEQRAARSAIDDLQIATPSHATPARNLSGGNQQKLVLARWLDAGADCFIFDEPTHGIDVGAKEEVYLLMERLAGEGRGVIFISSEFGELVGVCHRVLILREGRIVEELVGDEVTESRMVSACYAAETPVPLGTVGVDNGEVQ